MVRFHGLTDVGRRRPLNEDAIHAEDGLFVVCDGMGGHKAGEVASRLAVETVAGFIRRSTEDPEMTWPYGYDTTLPYDVNRLGTAIKLANRVVSRKAASAEDYTGMGTTIVAALVHPRRPHLTYAHAGDSRLYLIRSGGMTQLTRDDTWANLEWADPADAPAYGSMRNVLTKALGARDDIELDVRELVLQDGDVVLLCSDGLTNMLSDAEILGTLTTAAGDLQEAAQNLVFRANAEGGRDNVSVVLVQYER